VAESAGSAHLSQRLRPIDQDHAKDHAGQAGGHRGQPNDAHRNGVPEQRDARARLCVLVLVVWLVIGAIAAGQRHNYSGSSTNCARLGTIAVTVLAGPLNYLGVNLRISCEAP